MTHRSGGRETGAVAGLLMLLVGGAVVWGLAAGGSPPWAGAGSEPEVSSPASAAGGGIPSRPDDAFALTVTYVFDGDTIEAHVVTPNEVVSTTEPVRVRLIGIDTPEGTPSPECWADEARVRLETLLPEGSTVWASPDVEPRDRYDRALLYLWTEDGRFVNHELVAGGDAEALRVPPNTAHADLFTAAQAAAQASGAGQWGACG